LWHLLTIRWQHIGGTKERKGIKDLEATDKSEALAAPNPKSSDPKQEVHAWGVAAAAVYECSAIKAEPEIMHSRNTVLEGEEAAVAVAEVFVSAVSSGTFLEYLFTVKIGDRTFTMEELLNPGGLFSWELVNDRVFAYTSMDDIRRGRIWYNTFLLRVLLGMSPDNGFKKCEEMLGTALIVICSPPIFKYLYEGNLLLWVGDNPATLPQGKSLLVNLISDITSFI
jgi:hypothetical protein